MSPKKKKKTYLENKKAIYEPTVIPVVIGHRSCVPKMKSYNVPKRMGWLWNAHDVPWTPYRPGWEPGAINKGIIRTMRKTYPNIKIDTNVLKLPVTSNIMKKDDKHVQKIPNPAVLVQKKDGKYSMNIKPIIENIENRNPWEYPFTEGEPFYCHVDNEEGHWNKTKEMYDKHLENELLKLAFDNICNEIYANLDKDQLNYLAKKHNTCHCQIVQPEIINNMFMCDCCENFEDIDCGCTSTDSQNCMSNSWSVEYTPACAKYDRLARPKTSAKMNKSTQYDGRHRHAMDCSLRSTISLYTPSNIMKLSSNVLLPRFTSSLPQQQQPQQPPPPPQQPPLPQQPLPSSPLLQPLLEKKLPRKCVKFPSKNVSQKPPQKPSKKSQPKLPPPLPQTQIKAKKPHGKKKRQKSQNTSYSMNILQSRTKLPWESPCQECCITPTTFCGYDSDLDVFCTCRNEMSCI